MSITNLLLSVLIWENTGVGPVRFSWLLSGLATVIAAFYFFWTQRKHPPETISSSVSYLNIALATLIFVGGSWYCGTHLSEIYAKYPVDALGSDIVPSLQAYVRRLLSGDTVYRPIEFPTWTVHPTYLPMMWLPYIFSELLEIDYRWTAYAVFLLAILLYNIRLLRQSPAFWEVILKTCLPFFLLYQIITYADKSLGYGVELLPAAFYLFLTLTVFSRSLIWMAVGIVLCLLSRYAFTFWLPVYMIVLWAERGFPTAFKVGLWTALGVLLIYIIPFLSKDWNAFSKGLAYYEKTAVDQWYPQSWQPEGEPPFHLSQGLSFAWYFYEYDSYTVPDRLAFNKKVHMLVSLLAALLILGGYFLLRKKQIDPRLYLIIALKFYLIVFYGFLFVPFRYLYMLPLFLSVPLFYNLPLRQIFSRHSKSMV